MNAVAMENSYQTSLSGGKHWSLRVRRGLAMRLTDLQGGANVGMVLYNMHDHLERFNAPDTLKCQHTFHLHQGHCLYSDMGRILASVVTDTVGGHDTVCGNSDASLIERQFGRRDYQNDRNHWHQNGHDAFMVELCKYGMDRRDLPANINWFSQCSVSSEGDIALIDAHSPAGSEVVLRFEMDCLVVLHTCPHPLAQYRQYPNIKAGISLSCAAPLDESDACRNSCDENRRGFENNRLYHLCG